MMADPVSRGAVISIIFPWWLSGCPEIDVKKDMQIQELTGLNNCRWSRHRVLIKDALLTLSEVLRGFHKKAMLSQEKIAKRNEQGSRALAEYRQKKFFAKKACVNNDVLLSDEVSGYRVDRVLPSTLPKSSHHTPNSFKHRPEKPVGTLRDKWLMWEVNTSKHWCFTEHDLYLYVK